MDDTEVELHDEIDPLKDPLLPLDEILEVETVDVIDLLDGPSNDEPVDPDEEELEMSLLMNPYDEY